jgi:hypothetical protein
LLESAARDSQEPVPENMNEALKEQLRSMGYLE